MADKYILAIDEGTTSTRAIIYDHQGRQVASAAREFPQYFPEPGWVEHKAEEIWNAVQITVSTALINSAIRPDQIAGIGISNQRETTVIWDKATGRPIYNAVVWQSRQSTALAEQLKREGYGEMIRKKTGLIIDLTSPRPRSAGFWTGCLVPRSGLRKVSSCLGPSILGWPGN